MTKHINRFIKHYSRQNECIIFIYETKAQYLIDLIGEKNYYHCHWWACSSNWATLFSWKMLIVPRIEFAIERGLLHAWRIRHGIASLGEDTGQGGRLRCIVLQKSRKYKRLQDSAPGDLSPFCLQCATAGCKKRYHRATYPMLRILLNKPPLQGRFVTGRPGVYILRHSSPGIIYFLTSFETLVELLRIRRRPLLTVRRLYPGQGICPL